MLTKRLKKAKETKQSASDDLTKLIEESKGICSIHAVTLSITIFSFIPGTLTREMVAEASKKQVSLFSSSDEASMYG